MTFSEEWFKELFGSEPYPKKSRQGLEEELKEASQLLLWCQHALAERDLWEARRDGARAGWGRAEACDRPNMEYDIMVLEVARILADIAGWSPALSPKALAKEVQRRHRALVARVAELERSPGTGDTSAERWDQRIQEVLRRIYPGAGGDLNALGVAKEVEKCFQDQAARIQALETKLAAALDANEIAWTYGDAWASRWREAVREEARP